jgi:biotin synthase
MSIKKRQLELIVAKIINKQLISEEDAFSLLSPEINIWDLLHGANIIRRHFINEIHLCSIINAKSGGCKEDCIFCSQSFLHNTKINNYPLVGDKTIKDAYHNAQYLGVDGFSIVTSGNMLSGYEVNCISKVVRDINLEKNDKPYVCVSIGHLTLNYIKKLKESGLTKCHHNLETSREFFPKICSTHSYDERIETIKCLKKIGIKVCSGGIFGIGENWNDRISLAFTLKKLGVDSVPLNFLIPIRGTLLSNKKLLSPMEALKIVAIFRYILIDKDIRICAGREMVFRDLQSLIYYAGANGMMIGGYLTQSGRPVKDDIQMLHDLELR